MKTAKGWQPAPEQYALFGAIILASLNTGLFFTHAPSIQDASALLGTANLFVTLFWRVVLFAGTALVVVTAIGKLDARLCLAGCGLLTIILGLLISLT